MWVLVCDCAEVLVATEPVVCTEFTDGFEWIVVMIAADPSMNSVTPITMMYLSLGMAALNLSTKSKVVRYYLT